MSDQPIDRLDDELAALLAAERGAEPSREALDRVWSRLAVSLPTGPGSGGSGGGSSPAGRGAASTLAGHLGSKGLATLAAVFLGGGAVGAAVHAAIRPAPATQIVYVDRFVTAPASASAAVPAARAVASDTATAVVEAPPTPPARPRSSAGPAQLERERAMLDEARSALQSGDGAAALAAIDRHARGFARPELAEEREALAVQALVISGRYDEARARAARFRASSPHSLFMPAVDASLASIP